MADTTQGTRFGLSCALLTPFGADGRVDPGRLARHAARVLDEGCDGVTLCGTTGEGASVALQERAVMLGALARAGIAGERIHVGVAASVVDDAVAQGRQALDAGAAGLLLAPPFYFKGVGDEGLLAWFCAVIGALEGARGIVLYHIPSVTAVPLSVDLVGRLRRAFPEAITGVKDSSGDWATTQGFLAAHGDLAILVGDERILPRAVRAGAGGSICGLANIVAGRLRPIVHEGRDDAAVSALVEAVVARPIVPALKSAVARATRDADWAAVRPPLTALSAAEAGAFLAEHDAILGGATA
ncbi:dihydrodipicolinate synthase family protein [Salinarimonas soli]|uniref:Dihydrodipicolinate synthase family protein n=1 Tax=Salinarimonas soli TaxID=1638099 RepID=A0A5B2VY54_9HYPH|nr:dihydrodipicolinate synthase family protein [Salinarimonas soli]KAA2244321.1 dihydrodipicolinate synthase family protein [Salinarimonas soli]